MTITNTQLYQLVAEELALIGPGQALSADDRDRIERREQRRRKLL